jgi:RHS repeat-associated protein
MRICDLRFAICDLGLSVQPAVHNQQSAISNRKSEITNRKSEISRPSHIPFLLIVLTFLCLGGLVPLHAADKSGVGSQAISLPTGPGSIEGLGDSFQPALNTGTAQYSIPLEVPPGPAGHAPALALRYDGGLGNGPLGFGWQLPVPFVQRRVDHGIPRYVDTLQNGQDDDQDGQIDEWDEVDTYINEIKEELVPVTNQYYFCENEGPFIRYQRFADHWEGIRPDGTKLEFGLTESGRLSDATTGRVFRWFLERETDPHGNTIRYAYTSFPGAANTNQVYLREIAYAAGPGPWTHFHFVRFEYEDRDDWFEDGRSGFIVRTGKRLNRIIVATQGVALEGHLAGDFNQDGQTDSLVRRYELGYAASEPHWSLLSTVRLVGADGQTSLPPTTFGYTPCHFPGRISALGQVIGGLNEPVAVMDNPLVELLEVNGDALPDLLKTDRFGGRHTVYLNLGVSRTNNADAIAWGPPLEMESADGLAWQINLEAENRIAHLADMNGDGLADLVYRSALGDVYYFLNEGRLRWGTKTPMSLLDFAPPSPFAQADARSADVDFDKRLDVIQSVATGIGADYRIWFNRGGQSFSRPVTVSQTSGFMFSQSGVEVADFNGDRVPDVLRLRPTTVSVTAGLGHGHFAPAIPVAIPDWTLDETQIGRAAWQDVSGDGLADLVVPLAAPGQCWLWINLGNYTLSPRKILEGLPSVSGVNAVIRWADLNGNGTTDLLLADSASLPRIATVDVGALAGCVPRPHALTSIDNGIGRVMTLTYSASTLFATDDAAAGQPWPDPLPFPVAVVSRVTVSDSLGHDYVTDYRYHDGYYDGAEREFRGFARVEQIEAGDATAPTLVTRSYFDTGKTFEAMKGKLLRQTTEQEDGRSFWDEQTQWTTPPKELATGLNGQPIHFAHPQSRRRVLTELGRGTPRVLEWEFDYDSYGNQILEADYGVVTDGDRSAFDDERILHTDYAVNLDRWMVRYPSGTQLTDEEGTVVARTEIFYDDETFSGQNLGQVLLGNVTLRRDWTDPADPLGYVASMRTKYDVYGQPILWLDPLASAEGGVVSVEQGHCREVAYDGDFHTYPVRETIHVGPGKDPLIMQADYDAGFGTARSSLDFNGLQTTYTHDPLARLLTVSKPGDNTAYPSLEFQYALAQPAAYWSANGLVHGTGIVNYVETRRLDQSEIQNPRSEMYFISREYLDGLGRVWMTKEEAGPDPETGQPRVAVLEAALFNARGTVASVLNPFYSNIGAANLDGMLAFEDVRDPGWQGRFQAEDALVPLGLSDAHRSDRDYDALLRLVQVVHPDGSRRRILREPLSTRNEDENDTDPASPHFGTPLVYHHDGLGRLIQTDEIVRLQDDGLPSGQAQTWSSSYRYDLNDALLEVIDAQTNTRVMIYDGLGRLTFVNDPDRGQLRFTYDDASNLRERLDAKGQRTVYTYDGVNRLLTEDYRDEQAPFSHHYDYDPLFPVSPSNRADVCYFYDAPRFQTGQEAQAFPTRNTKGYLASVWDLSGAEHTSYDDRGRVESTLKLIPDPVHGNPVGYQTSFAYDAMDRLVSLTYPDHDRIEYGYNARNLLRDIHGESSISILDDLAYTPSGQSSAVRYGNQVTTTYAYDRRLRLTRLKTVRPAAEEEELVHLDYVLDPASNVLAIQDRRPGALVPSGDPRHNSQTFEYDDLNRIVRAAYSFQSPSEQPAESGHIQYRYDRIGNMIEKTSTLIHEVQGRSVVDLGTLNYGAGATFNRLGRGPADPPGPHALTSIENPESGIRNYPYDANGNTTEVDGLDCVRDFKDRLVEVEDEAIRAQYVYDYTDRRILKRLTFKQDPIPPQHTLYVGRHFEVRDGEQPVKYVWNGETRIARVTASLSARPRTQHVRVLPGWNLLSLAVELNQAGTQLKRDTLSGPSPVEEMFQWDEAARRYTPVQDTSTLPAGAVLWLRASRGDTLSVTGVYRDPTNRVLNPGPGSYLGAGLEAFKITNALPADAQIWMFDPVFQRWTGWLPAPSGILPPPPDWFGPGQAIYVNVPSPGSMVLPDPDIGIRYYHQDHVASTAVLTDAQGRILDEAAYYPFGRLRHDYRPVELPADYRFAQKERDGESGFHYFESRYLFEDFGRFGSVDPMAEHAPADWNLDPQRHNPYAYSLSNPLKFQDPDGREARVIQLDNDNVLIQIRIKYYGRYATQENIARANEGIEEAWTGKFGRYTVRTQVVESDPTLKPSTVFLGNLPRSHVRPGPDLGFWNPHDFELGDLAAHESGHLLGLLDRYKDFTKNGKLYSKPDKGWEGNLLAERGGSVDQRNINILVNQKGYWTQHVHFADFRTGRLRARQQQALRDLQQARQTIKNTERKYTERGRKLDRLLNQW